MPPVNSFSDIAERVIPSVVYIFAEMEPRPGQVLLSAGTGVIVRSDGYILTNKHVIEGAKRIDVTLENRETYEVKGFWLDDMVDLAVVKIDEVGLPAIAYADPYSIRVGDWVLAFGHALGVSPLDGGLSVTSGVVSSLGRTFSIEGEQHYDVVQTDAAINPGNSGGPLVNTSGMLVGINTAGAIEAQNIGFAINVAIARHVFEDLVEYGESHHPYLGVVPGDVTQERARRLECDCIVGAAVLSLEPDSPATAAGLREDDIIIRVGGNVVGSAAELIRWLWRYDVGDVVEVTVWRGGEEKTFSVILAEHQPGDGV
jgi:serine protease Do